MKTGKRILSILLIAMMLITVIPLAVMTKVKAEGNNYQVGDVFKFGTYPQSVVSETSKLKAAAETSTWKSYNYYSSMDGGYSNAPSDFMRFSDFICDGVKYRAVFFDEYRPEDNYINTISYQSRNGFVTGKVYYFKYEPLMWRVLDPATGLVVCENVIDSQAFQDICHFEEGSAEYEGSVSGKCWYDVNETIYASEYSTSTIREWLNHDFYETAFSTNQRTNISLSELNNTPSFANYSSPSTTDKIFLLSYDDLINSSYGFSPSNSIEDSNRRTHGTAYAKCQGLLKLGNSQSMFGDSCTWWLRSRSQSYSAYSVEYSGRIKTSRVYHSCMGVRPACYLTSINEDDSLSTVLFSEVSDEPDNPNNPGGPDNPNTNTVEIHAVTFDPQSTTGIYQVNGILENYVTTVILNGSEMYVGEVTIDGKKYNVQKNVLDSEKAKQLKGKNVICNYDKNTDEIIAISKCREFSDLDSTDISAINNERRISVIIESEYKWSSGKVRVAGGAKEVYSIPFQIEICNSLPSAYFDLTDECKSNSKFDLKISALQVRGVENCGDITLYNNSPRTIKLGGVAIIKGIIRIPADFWLGYEDGYKKISAEYGVLLNDVNIKGGVFHTVVINRDPKPQPQSQQEAYNSNKLLADAANKLKSSSVISLSGLSKLKFSLPQIQFLEKLVLVELSMFTMPDESLEEYVSNKVMEKIFGAKKLIDVKNGKITIVIPYQNRTKQLDIVCDIQEYSLTNRTFGNFTSLTYHAYEVKNGKREKIAFEDGSSDTGIAGLAVSANVKAFAEAATDFALAEIKSATKTVLEGYEEVERIIFGDAALKILKAAGYNSNFDFGWDLYVNECKKLFFKCPVDVYVYDKNDTLCGAIVNNEVTLDTSDDVDLEVINDEKLVTLWEDGYYVKTLANCEGTLNISVKEQGYISGALRTLTFENLPLRVGTLYRQDYGTGYNDDQSAYEVEELNGDRIEATSDVFNLLSGQVDSSHTYIPTVTTPATCTEPGEMTYTCVDGDDTYTETIPATGHADDNNDGHCDACGEQMTGGDHCKFCGKIHNGGFFDKLTGFFHKIFAIFKR